MVEPPLLVVLLPCRLEDFGRRSLAEALLESPSAVAVEPGRVSHERLARLPDLVEAALAGMQARRMRLPGAPGAVLLFDPAQYPLARALLAQSPGCELWYGPAADAAGELHELAVARSVHVFEDSSAGRAELEETVARSGLGAS